LGFARSAPYGNVPQPNLQRNGQGIDKEITTQFLSTIALNL